MDFEPVISRASVQYDDFLGTAAADAQMSGVAASLGLDEQRWWVVGVEFSVYEGSPGVTLHLLDHQRSADRRTLEDIAANGGQIEVESVRFYEEDIPGGLAAWIGTAFKRLHVVLSGRHLEEFAFVAPSSFDAEEFREKHGLS